jgi:TonB family protein
MSLLLPSTLLLLAAACASLALRRHSAARRHIVWLMAFSGLVALPLLRIAAPTWQAPTPALELARTIQRTVERTVIFVSAAEPTPSSPALWLTSLWLTSLWLTTFWLTGVALCAARFLWAYRQTASLAAAAEPWQSGVRLSPHAHVPFVCGLFQPVILLPESARAWPPHQLEAVLAHERMHITRRDNLWQAMAQLVCSLYWPQPFVWLAARAMRQECERACDDGVLVHGTPATAYADVLVNIARGLSAHSAPTGALTMTRTTQLHHRIAALLDRGINRQPAGRAFTLAAATFAFAAVLSLGGLQTPLFAQQSRLSGVVQDPSGANISRARIDLRTPGTDTVREVIYTNAAGEFSLDNVPDGTYDMTVAAPGFALLTQSNLVFENGKTQPFKVTLNVGKVRERVAVQAPGDSPAPTAEQSERRWITRFDTEAPGGTRAPTPAGAPQRVRVGGNVQQTKLVHKVNPLYPPTAKQDRVQGTVLLRAIISADGSVLHLEPLNRAVDSRLVEASLTAVRQWRYTPMLLNGLPVEVVSEIEVNFTLAP